MSRFFVETNFDNSKNTTIEVEAEEFPEALYKAQNLIEENDSNIRFKTYNIVEIRKEKLCQEDHERIYKKDEIPELFLTVDDIEQAYDNGIISVIYDEEYWVVLAAIGEYEFSFSPLEDQFVSVEDFLANTNKESIIWDIYEAIDEMIIEEPTAYTYCLAVVREGLDKINKSKGQEDLRHLE